tara:strand:+ start:13 stop:690 length:678 start_codon:yes stop_codon:yes gene_type:complete
MKNILKVLKIIYIILKKDLLQEIKSKEIIISMLSYSVLVLVVVATTLKINSNNSLIIFGTIYWISVSFSILLGINKSMSKEMDNKGIELLILAPIDQEIIIVSKIISNFFFTLLSSFIILFSSNVLFNNNLLDYKFIILIIISALGFSIVGTITSFLFSKSRGKEILSPLLFIPLVSPLLMASSSLTNQILNNEIQNQSWYGLIIGYDLLFFILGISISNFIYKE